MKLADIENAIAAGSSASTDVSGALDGVIAVQGDLTTEIADLDAAHTALTDEIAVIQAIKDLGLGATDGQVGSMITALTGVAVSVASVGGDVTASNTDLDDVVTDLTSVVSEETGLAAIDPAELAADFLFRKRAGQE